MNASTTIALLRIMTDMCETVGAVTPVESLSACTGDVEGVDMDCRERWRPGTHGYSPVMYFPTENTQRQALFWG